MVEVRTFNIGGTICNQQKCKQQKKSANNAYKNNYVFVWTFSRLNSVFLDIFVVVKSNQV